MEEFQRKCIIFLSKCYFCKEASFMTIYANGAKDKKGNYDPIKILAEICAEDTLNGNVVRLTFNTVHRVMMNFITNLFTMVLYLVIITHLMNSVKIIF